ncbi:hypothetical protein Tco_0671290 [Tanacetum coccineum]
MLTTPPDIIDVDEDDDIINEEDPIPHNLADSDDEDLINLDIDDGVNVMSADVARGHGGAVMVTRSPSIPNTYRFEGCLGKGTKKPNLGGRRAGRMHTRQETRNLGLKAITDKNSPMESSATREYPSLIHTFFLTHTVSGVFLNPEDKALYDEMLRLQGLGSNTPSGVPYTDDEIMVIVHGASNGAHSRCWSDDKFSQILTQLESQLEYGGGGESGRCEDDESDSEMMRIRAVNIDLYLADNASFVTSSPVL